MTELRKRMIEDLLRRDAHDTALRISQRSVVAQLQRQAFRTLLRVDNSLEAGRDTTPSATRQPLLRRRTNIPETSIVNTRSKTGSGVSDVNDPRVVTKRVTYSFADSYGIR
jgi:hypothetical protein